MATLSQEKRVKKWSERVRASNGVYKSWADKFDTDRLEDYYEGRQWRGVEEDVAKKKYVINLVFANVETNKPALIFNSPQVRMAPKPAKEDDLGSRALERAMLCQDTVQTFLDDPDFAFVEETTAALHETHFRFGVVEVGYTADWIDNPNAGKPQLDDEALPGENGEKPPLLDSDKKPVMEPEFSVKSEQMFIKHIPAETFRVSISDKPRPERNDWVGYYEWHQLEDLLENPHYKKGAKGLKASGILRAELQDTSEGDDTETLKKHNSMCKVWKVWDLRLKKKHVFVQGHDKFLAENVDFKFLPFAFLRFFPRLKSFYPMPPVSQWLFPQDELNETRESQRAHRRRFYRRYTTLKGSIDDDQIEKLETGGDGVIAESNMPNPLQPVSDAPQGGDVWANLDTTKQDYMSVSGISGDQRGVAESETATQANIIDQHSKLREGSARAKVQKFLADCARLILLTAIDSMALPFWVKRNVDATAAMENGGAEVMDVAQKWQEITHEDLEGIDMEVTIDLSSMSPVSQQAEQMSWTQVLTLLKDPQACLLLAQSPALLRKTLRLWNVTSKSEILEIETAVKQTAMMIQLQQQAEAEAQEGPGGENPTAPMPGEPMETPAEMGGGTIQ